MAMIKVENLTFSYPGSYDNVFLNTSFQIDTNWKLGFVGRNGRGKTTFLKLLMGEFFYSGKISCPVKFDYFPFEVSDSRQNVLDVLHRVAPLAMDWEFIRELTRLEVDRAILRRPFCTLSNGEQAKVLLAALFLNNNRFLLIDEPTNHLDARGRELVSRYLNGKKGFILVSHDRDFLDGCVDHILSINRMDIQVQEGNFSSFIQNFENQQKKELAENQQLKKDIAVLNRAANSISAWSHRAEAVKTQNGHIDKGYVGHKAAKVMKRAKVLQERKYQAIQQKEQLLKNREQVEELTLWPLEYKTEKLLSFYKVSVCYNEKVVCGPVTFEINRGDKVALAGSNGSGKSSMLKALLNKDLICEGKLYAGSDLIISYVPQNVSQMRGTLSEYARQYHIELNQMLTILRKMGFDRSQFEKTLENFSEGQKKKIALAKSMCERAHIYLWDEPLNYVDVYTRLQIQRAIVNSNATLLFVEHDKAFKNAVATKIIELL